MIGRYSWPHLPYEPVPVAIIARVRAPKTPRSPWAIGLGQSEHEALKAVMLSAASCADYVQLKNLSAYLKLALRTAEGHDLEISFAESDWQVAIKWEVIA